MSVDASGAIEKAKAIREAIARAIEEALPKVREALISDALTRTPTIDQEYNALMASANSVSSVPRDGDRSADRDDRIRMDKPEETYLENAVPSDENSTIDGTRVSIGNQAFLDAMTTYRYTNIMRTGFLTSEPVEHEVGPYFAALDEGGTATIVPVFQWKHSYRLRPVDDNKHPGFDSMVKTFASIPHNIFAPFALLAAAQETLKTALAALNGA